MRWSLLLARAIAFLVLATCIVHCIHTLQLRWFSVVPLRAKVSCNPLIEYLLICFFHVLYVSRLFVSVTGDVSVLFSLSLSLSLSLFVCVSVLCCTSVHVFYSMSITNSPSFTDITRKWKRFLYFFFSFSKRYKFIFIRTCRLLIEIFLILRDIHMYRNASCRDVDCVILLFIL